MEDGLTMAVTADSHLGKRFPTLEFRERDIIDGFDLLLSSIISDRADLLVHGGDLFDTVFPPGWIFELGLSAIQSVPQSVKECSIVEEVSGQRNAPNIFIVHGNHDGTTDARCESGYFSVLKYFDSMSLANYLDVRKMGESLCFPKFICEGGGMKIAIQGLGHRSISQFQNIFAGMEPVKGVDHNILIIHQSLADLTTPYTRGEILPMDLFVDKGYDLIIAGHTHKPMDDEIHGTRFLIPGSSERIDSGEFGERKGYYMVRMTPEDIECSFRMVDLDQVRKIRKYEVDVDGLSGSEITEQCLQSMTDPNIVDALIYFIIRGQTPHGHRDVDRSAIQESLVQRGAKAVKVNTEKVIMKEIGELVSDAEWRNIKITADTFQRLFTERNIRDLSGTPIRDDSVIALLSQAAYRIYRAFERDEKQEVPSILEKDLLAIAEGLYPAEEEEDL